MEAERPFNDLGLTSVYALELRNRLTMVTGIRLSPIVAFEYPTPRALARFLRTELITSDEQRANGAHISDESEQYVPESPDFEAEVRLADDVIPAAEITHVVSDPKEVFLTGATGFLGAYLLRDLMRLTSATVHCLVRASDEATALDRLRANLEWYGISDEVDTKRLSIVVGDLAQPRLGLSQSDFDTLARTIDVVYHSGALANWVYPYSMLKPANVSGTEEILRLAAAHRTVPVHYMSSIGVFADPTPDGGPMKTDDATGPAAALSNGYRQSKWVAEEIVRLAKTRGLPVSIYRASTISGDQESGACQTSDFIWLSLKGCLQAQMVPDDATAAFSVVPVDYVSATMINISRKTESAGQTFHIDNREPLQFDEMVKYLRSRGYTLETVPRDTFNKTVSSDRENAIFPVIDIFNGFNEQNAAHGDYYLALDISGTERILADSGITCPKINETLFGTYVDFFVESGYFPQL